MVCRRRRRWPWQKACRRHQGAPSLLSVVDFGALTSYPGEVAASRRPWCRAPAPSSELVGPSTFRVPHSTGLGLVRQRGMHLSLRFTLVWCRPRGGACSGGAAERAAACFVQCVAWESRPARLVRVWLSGKKGVCWGASRPTYILFSAAGSLAPSFAAHTVPSAF